MRIDSLAEDSGPDPPSASSPRAWRTDAAPRPLRWSAFDYVRLQRQLEERALPGHGRRWEIERQFLAQTEAEGQEGQTRGDLDIDSDEGDGDAVGRER